MLTSIREITDIIISMLVIAGLLPSIQGYKHGKLYITHTRALVAVGLDRLSQLAHNHGSKIWFYAEYRYGSRLILAIVTGFGICFRCTSAVYIHDRHFQEKTGKISIAGP